MVDSWNGIEPDSGAIALCLINLWKKPDRRRCFDLDQNAMLTSAVGTRAALQRGMVMIVDKFVAGLIGSALGLAVAVAISHAPDQTDSNDLSEARPPVAAICPKIDWPYGCNWHPESTLPLKHFSMHRNNHNRGSLSFFR